MRRFPYALKLLRQLVQFAHQNRIYWLVPLALALAVSAFFIVVGQSAAPLIYTLF